MICNEMELFNVALTDKVISRIPKNAIDSAHELGNTYLSDIVAFFTAGCELRFFAESEEVAIEFEIIQGEPYQNSGLCEIYYGDYPAWDKTNFVHRFHFPQVGNYSIKVKRPEHNIEFSERFNPKLIRVILPHDRIMCIKSIKGDLRAPTESDVPKKRFVAYGSSITNGFYAMRAQDAYPQRIAKKLKIDVYNLGFSGCAQMEPEIAKYIASLPFEFVTLEMGINVLGLFSPEVFEKKVFEFVSIIHNANVDKKIFCLDIFKTGNDNSNILNFRKIVKECVNRINSKNVIHIPGEKINPIPTDMTSDLLHPSTEGFEDMANNLLNYLN